MRCGVGVDARLRREARRAARVGLVHGGLAEERRVLHGLGELRAELAEGEELRAVAHEAERRDLPERGRAAVAEHDLVALGEGEQVGEAGAQTTDLRLDGLLPVRGAEVGRRDGCEGGHLLGADLARSGAEAAVARQEVGGDGDLRRLAHRT